MLIYQRPSENHKQHTNKEIKPTNQQKCNSIVIHQFSYPNSTGNCDKKQAEERYKDQNCQGNDICLELSDLFEGSNQIEIKLRGYICFNINY